MSTYNQVPHRVVTYLKGKGIPGINALLIPDKAFKKTFFPKINKTNNCIMLKMYIIKINIS